MVISLHMPKTAGSSFRQSLFNVFGSRILTDYQDLPLHTGRLRRKYSAIRNLVFNYFRDFDEIECIHGHFLPIKYLMRKLHKKTIFITWLRNPVERMVSHYYFMKKSYNPEKPHFLHKKAIEENWSLERFCFSREFQNVYAQFFWGFPLNCFDFIGITEFYEEDLGYFFETYLDETPVAFKQNVNRDKKVREFYGMSNRLRSEIEIHHRKDMAIYRHACDLRLKRKNVR